MSAAENIYGVENSVQEAASYVYKPSAWQTEIHTAPVNFLLGAGAAGVGKTLAMIMEPLGQIISEHHRCEDKAHPYPLRWGHSTGWALYLRRELRQLEQTIERTMRLYPQIDRRASYSAKSYTWTFASGYKVQFGHCKDPNDHEAYLSNEYTVLLPDELTTFPANQIDLVRSRVRSSDPCLRPMCRTVAMSNPGKSPGADPDWVKKMFVDPWPAGRKLLVHWKTRRDGTRFKRTHMYIPGRLTDNPNRDFANDYEETLLSLPEHLVRAYLDGDWNFTPGAFFANAWDPRFHIVKPFRPPLHWPIFRSMDWGYRLPGCVHWWTLDDDSNLICFEELKFQEMQDAQVARRIKEIETRLGLWSKKNNRSLITGPADTQIWEERGDSAKKKVEIFAENGVIWHQADKHPGSRAHHAQRVTKLLKSHNGGTQYPGLAFMTNCPYAIATIPQMRVDEDKPEEPLKDDNDHAYDSVAYAVAWASQGRQAITMSEERDRGADEMDRAFDVPSNNNAQTGRGAYGMYF